MESNLLILSDLHLGEQEPGEDRGYVEQRADVLANQFGSFLEYYSQNRRDGLPWRLVIAGDMIDFMRIHVPCDNKEGWDNVAHHTTPRPDQALWKLPEHDLAGTLAKVEQLFVLNGKTFRHLVRFLLAGHELRLVTGNHDAELDWPEVQELMREKLTELARRERPHADVAAMQERIEFCPRFYYEPGRVYIEHGHYYDGYCKTEETMPPIWTSQGLQDRRLNSLSHQLNFTQFNNPKAFDTLPLHHIDQWSALDILGWYFKRPFSQQFLLFRTFAMMVFQIVFMAWSSSFRSLLNLKGKERQDAIKQWADNHNLPVEAVEPLQQYVTPAIHTRFFDTMQALYIDRMILMAGTAFFMTVCLVAPWTSTVKAGLMTLNAAFFVGAFQYLARRRPLSETIPMLFAAATKISNYLNTPLVIMAHSHHYEQKELNGGKLYVNLGSWVVPHSLLHTAPEPQPKFSLPETPATAMYGVPDFETRYMMITSQQHPHHCEIGSWSYHSGAPTLEPVVYPVTDTCPTLTNTACKASLALAKKAHSTSLVS